MKINGELVTVRVEIHLYGTAEGVTDEDRRAAVAQLLHDIDNLRPNDFLITVVKEIR